MRARACELRGKPSGKGSSTSPASHRPDHDDIALRIAAERKDVITHLTLLMQSPRRSPRLPRLKPLPARPRK